MRYAAHVKATRALLVTATTAACLDATGIVLRDNDGGTSDAAPDVQSLPVTLRFAHVSDDVRTVNVCVTPSGSPYAAPMFYEVAELALSAPVVLDGGGPYDIRVSANDVATCELAIVETVHETLSSGPHTLFFIGSATSADGGPSPHPLGLLLLGDDPPQEDAGVLRPLNVSTETATVTLDIVVDGGAQALTEPLSYATLAKQNASPNGYVSLAPGAQQFVLVEVASNVTANLTVATGGIYSLFAIDSDAGGALVCDELAIDGGFAFCVVQ
jgi:hypothetical protein